MKAASGSDCLFDPVIRIATLAVLQRECHAHSFDWCPTTGLAECNR